MCSYSGKFLSGLHRRSFFWSQVGPYIGSRSLCKCSMTTPPPKKDSDVSDCKSAVGIFIIWHEYLLFSRSLLASGQAEEWEIRIINSSLPPVVFLGLCAVQILPSFWWVFNGTSVFSSWDFLPLLPLPVYLTVIKCTQGRLPDVSFQLTPLGLLRRNIMLSLIDIPDGD